MDISAVLSEIEQDAWARSDWGQVADYIPQLAGIRADQFAMAVCLADGTSHQVGATDVRFSIQSVSKVFALGVALGRLGDQLWIRVGREPSGSGFNSIRQLEVEQGRPRNPFINAGAIVTTDAILSGREPKQALAEILGFISALAEDDDIHIDPDVARSEMTTGARNKALAHYLQSFDNLKNEPERSLGTYFHQCAIEMTVMQLARAGRALAGFADAPRVIARGHVRRINALMMTCGHYDGSGEFAYRVGLPGKSGVGGGLLVIAPGIASVGIWSPGLDRYGNSQAGTRAAALLTDLTGWSVF